MVQSSNRAEILSEWGNRDLKSDVGFVRDDTNTHKMLLEGKVIFDNL